MLIWSGIVVGFAGQAVLLLAYTLTLTLAYAIIRPLMSSIIPYGGALGKLMYSLPESISRSGSTQHEFASMFLGLPMRITSDLFSSVDTSFFSKYLFMSVPDAMIFPSAFLYGYSVMSTDNGVMDTRNLFILFFLVLAMLLQKSVMDMSIFAVLTNFLIGILVGIVASSLISETPSLKPFNVNNQTFRIVVRNNNT
jgi:hypothetical protein